MSERLLTDILPDKRGAKVSWRKFKELHHTCDLDGRKSEKCQRLSKELGIDWIEEA